MAKRQSFSDSNGTRGYVPALGYALFTPLYDYVIAAAGGGERYLNALITHARLEQTTRVLDVACGTGTLAIAMKRHAPSAEITALDCDDAMLSRARYKAQQCAAEIRFDNAFAQHLPYPDAYFDCVVSSLFFHHLLLDDKHRVAQEMLRVLKPGGTFYVLDWGRAKNRLMRGLFFSVQLVDGFACTRDNVAGRLGELFTQAGFCDVAELASFNTAFGTLALYGGAKSRRL